MPEPVRKGRTGWNGVGTGWTASIAPVFLFFLAEMSKSVVFTIGEHFSAGLTCTALTCTGLHAAIRSCPADSIEAKKAATWSNFTSFKLAAALGQSAHRTDEIGASGELG